MKAFFIVVAYLLAHANAGKITAKPQPGDILQISRNNMKFNCVIAKAAPSAGMYVIHHLLYILLSSKRSSQTKPGCKLQTQDAYEFLGPGFVGPTYVGRTLT